MTSADLTEEQRIGLEILAVRTRYGQGRTRREIAAYMGVSLAYIQLIEIKALKKCRHPARIRHLRET